MNIDYNNLIFLLTKQKVYSFYLLLHFGKYSD